jgi:3-oxoacyl-[acyl-carrier-protein] synthase-1
MVQAFKSALADATWDLGHADYRLADLSGEQYGFKEAALALTRVLRTRKEEFDIWHPADCVGETGAAAALILVAVARAAVDRDYAPGPRAIAHLAGDDGQRAAFLLEGSSRA